MLGRFYKTILNLEFDVFMIYFIFGNNQKLLQMNKRNFIENQKKTCQNHIKPKPELLRGDIQLSD